MKISCLYANFNSWNPDRFSPEIPDEQQPQAAALTSIRFSPNPHQAHRIEWLPWARSTFVRAQAEDKPVLLSITAPWCYWCHIMDETTYSDPDVQSLLARGFISVRVDNDHRPDINARYNVGGWPTTGFLTPHGGLIGGATYLPPDQFLAMLMELEGAYKADKPRLYEQSRDLLQQRRTHARRVVAGAEVEASLVDRVSRIVAGAYDALNGGFGSEPKFPNPSILRYVLHLYRTTGEEFYASMLRKTLNRMADVAGVEVSGGGGQDGHYFSTPTPGPSAIYDNVTGGFFRYSATAEWSEPQREKLLEDNIQLASLYLDASIILSKNDQTESFNYLEVAEHTFTYVNNFLYDSDLRGFHGSQGAHSDYFALGRDERAKAPLPPQDPSCYGAVDAIAAAALLDASWKVEGRLGQHLGKVGRDVISRLEGMAAAGTFTRVYPEDRPGESPPLLADWAGLLAGLMQAHASTAEQRYLQRAVDVARVMVDGFFDEQGGGFFDIEADGDAVGHLQVREKQMPENMLAVRGLLNLYQVTRNEDYRQLCEATLSAFAGVFREQGEFAADFGLTVDLFCNPMVEVTVEGNPEDPACRELLTAATRLSNPNLEIKTVSANGSPLAHVCLDTLCLPPVSTAAALAESAAGIDNQPASPFQDIFQIFPGG